MRSLQRTLAVFVSALMLTNSVSVANACGPVYTTPIFVFETSPDLPFAEFTNGKIGIVRPSFGRKTLVIAYRYLNGGSFTSEEQEGLIAALKGTAPDDEGDSALKAWIDARKQFLKDEEELPLIYARREETGSYDFFPNCTKNAFDVALETLKNRIAAYGADDQNVNAWLTAQDTVFQNCSSGRHVPPELGHESPTWLRKDRDYQIAAAHFYSLNFEEARDRFEKISGDVDSPWQEIAPYLVARAFVRQASLEDTATKKRDLYEQAEKRLQRLSSGGGKFAMASVRMLGLVKYHLRPEERVVELGRMLAAGVNENVRQDLIDYVWLLDKFESQILKAEDERKKKLNPPDEKEDYEEQLRIKYERIQRGELIQIFYYPKPIDTTAYPRGMQLEVKHDESEEEILRLFERMLGSPLTPEQVKDIKQVHASALAARAERLSPNSRWRNVGFGQYEGDYWSQTELPLEMFPEFLRVDDLSDWILTLEANEPAAYGHALAKWRQSNSPAWLATTLIKAESSSPELKELMRAAEKIAAGHPAYATFAYHRVRLKTAMGDLTEARRLLDEVMSQPDVLPVSAQNQFLEQRMQLAAGLNEFLKSAQRKPVAFVNDGMIGKLRDMIEIAKGHWYPEYSSSATRGEHEQNVEDEYKDLLPWDDRVSFDDATLDVLNWHFSLQLLIEAARSPDVPEYLKRRLVLAAWTRAILLDNDKAALEIASDVRRLAPEMESVFVPYMKAPTAKERQRAAVYVLLRFPGLSPYIDGTLPTFATAEEINYFFSESWWCPLPQTTYDKEYRDIPKVVPKPAFLTAAQIEAAGRERIALLALGDGKSYLGKQVLEWANASPDDPRLPEALFIATKANETYKYGCDGWAYDEETRGAAARILRERYPRSEWTAKLSRANDN